jgi:hypothetical protein
MNNGKQTYLTYDWYRAAMLSNSFQQQHELNIQTDINLSYLIVIRNSYLEICL